MSLLFSPIRRSAHGARGCSPVRLAFRPSFRYVGPHSPSQPLTQVLPMYWRYQGRELSFSVQATNFLGSRYPHAYVR